MLRAFRQHSLAAGHSARTIDNRTYTIRRLVAEGLDLWTCDRDELTDWLATLRGRDGAEVERSTRATYRAQIRSFFAWMVDTGRREDDPSLKLPTPKVGRNLPRPVTPSQVQKILEACADQRAKQTRAYVILAAYAGLRVHEVAAVRGEDVLDGELMVRGKGGTRLTVPLHPAIAALAEGMPAAGWWFPSDTDVGHVHRVSVSQAIKRAMTRAGVPGTPHALRHHFGTQVLRSSGGDLRTTQRAMRHASPATTAIYTQIADETLSRAISGIPA